VIGSVPFGLPWRCVIFGIGTGEFLIIGAIALILFGPGRLPELFRSLGRTTHELRKAMTSVQREIEDAASDPNRDHDPKT
jgi:sec-independent protein translocase protein TatA